MDAPQPDNLSTLSGFLHYWQSIVASAVGTIFDFTAAILGFLAGNVWRSGRRSSDRSHSVAEIREIRTEQEKLKDEINDLRVLVASVPRREEIESIRRTVEDHFTNLNRRLDEFLSVVRS